MKAYWQLYQVVFAGFFLEHSQNEFLTNYFTLELQMNIVHFKCALDIVQSILAKSTITKEETFDIGENTPSSFH